MFAIYIFGLNITIPTNRPFDIKMYAEEFVPLFQMTNQTEVPLVQCTSDHLNFNEIIKNYYGPFDFASHLCPVLNQQGVVKGKVTSSIFKQLKITVARCNTADPTCMSDVDYAALEASNGPFTIAIPVINTLINPTEQVYK